MEAMTDEPMDWCVSDMSRPDWENPAFGPMTEAEAKRMEGNRPFYWAHKYPPVGAS
jgi:hypothetical protein